MLGYKIPKDKVKSFEKRKRPGIYFLFGASEKDKWPEVYLGQSGNVYRRLVKHLNSEKKNWWRYAVVFIGMEEFCTLYLERKLRDLAKECGRFEVETKKARKIDSSNPSWDQSWDGFFEWIKIFIKALGYEVLEPESRNSKLFYMEVEGGKATGQTGCSSGRFYVHEGSRIASRLEKGAFKGRLKGKVQKIRSNLLKKGFISETYEVTKEFYCSNPRMAAFVVTGRRRKQWKSMEDQSCNNLKKELRNTNDF